MNEVSSRGVVLAHFSASQSKREFMSLSLRPLCRDLLSVGVLGKIHCHSHHRALRKQTFLALFVFGAVIVTTVHCVSKRSLPLLCLVPHETVKQRAGTRDPKIRKCTTDGAVTGTFSFLWATSASYLNYKIF
jgi:hypothetical protein